MFKNHMINFIYIPYFDSVTLNIEYTNKQTDKMQFKHRPEGDLITKNI